MQNGVQRTIRWVVASAMLALPVILLFSSLRSLGELEEAKSIYLRDRAVTIAARLENLSLNGIDEKLFPRLADEEPALYDLRVFTRPGEEPDNVVLRSLWRGETLYHAERVKVRGDAVYRFYTPFHVKEGLRIARIDLADEAADYLVGHTRQHLLLSLLASVALVGFTLYFLWSERRTAALHNKQLELEHLAVLGKMSAVLAHEIRNPLGTIKGFVQLALEQANQTVRGMLGTAVEEIGRLEKLVNHLLLYGSPREAEVREVEWGRIAVPLEAHAREIIGSGRTRFTCRGNLQRLRTDPELLMQVLLNLVRNAVEAIGESSDGAVELTAEKTARGRVSIIVSDNGPGLPAKVRRKLFEPFTTTRANGTGLGLSIASKLTAALGGRLDLVERQPHGTRAMLDLTGE